MKAELGTRHTVAASGFTQRPKNRLRTTFGNRNLSTKLETSVSDNLKSLNSFDPGIFSIGSWIFLDEEDPLKFPENYPTSCLIGYVDLVDCMSAETYKQEVSWWIPQDAASWTVD